MIQRVERWPAPAEEQGDKFGLRPAESQEPKRQQMEMPRGVGQKAWAGEG